MSAETLIWRLRLTDQTSSAAKRVASALKAVESQQRRVQRADDARARQAEATARRVAVAAQRETAARVAQARRAEQSAARASAARVAAERRNAQQGARLNAAAFRRDQQAERRQQQSVQRAARFNAQAFRRDERAQRGAAVRAERFQVQQGRIMQRNQQSMQRGFNGGVALLGGIGFAAATALAGIAAGFGGVAFSAARAVVEVAAFRESSLAALEVVLGSAGAAGRTFRNALTIANLTPLDTADVIRQQQALAVAGFSERELTPLLAASSDLGAAFGSRASEGFSFAVGQIRAAGRLQGQELLQLQNANVSRERVLASIAQQLNLGTGQRGIDAAARAIRERRVSGNVGIQAALDAVRGGLNRGGPLGSLSLRLSQTLAGSISNATNAGFNFLASIDFAKEVPALGRLRDFLVRTTNALAEGAPLATRLRKAIGSIGNTLTSAGARTLNIIRGVAAFGRTALPIVRALGGGLLQGLRIGFTPLLAVLQRLAGGGGPSAQTLQALAFLAQGLGTAFGLAAAAVSTLLLGIGAIASVPTAAFGALVGLVGNLIPQVTGAFARIGAAISEGIAMGIRSVAGAPRAALQSLIATLPGAAALQLAIRSPSRVFRDQIGAQIPAGLALGIQQGTPAARGAIDQLVAPPSVEPGGLRRGGGGPITVHVTVEGSRDAAQTGEAVADAVRRTLQSVFVELAEAGA